MSRTGKKVINFEPTIKVKLEDRHLLCQGPKGNLKLRIPDNIELKIEKQAISVVPSKLDDKDSKSLLRMKDRQSRSSWGTMRQLVANSLTGVTSGFQKILILEGVGFKAAVSGQKLTLSAGYSHPVEYELPSVVTAKVEENTKLILTSCDKQQLGQVAAEIKAIRKPEPYKGKGIRYENEVIKRKAGKTGKK